MSTPEDDSHRIPFNVRWPKSLRDEIFAEARAEGCTVNDFVVRLLTERMDEIAVKRMEEVKELQISLGSHWSAVIGAVEDESVERIKHLRNVLGPRWATVLKTVEKEVNGKKQSH